MKTVESVTRIQYTKRGERIVRRHLIDYPEKQGDCISQETVDLSAFLEACARFHAACARVDAKRTRVDVLV